MTNASLDRATLRKDIRSRRKAFVEALPQSVRTLAFRVLPSPVMSRIAPGARIAIYLSVGSEAPTGALIEFLHERGFPLCLPRIDPAVEGGMDFCAWAPGDPLVPGQLKIPQPTLQAQVVTPDVFLTPMVAFDSTLNRMGNGAGYYDRAFERMPEPLRIGLAWSAQMVDSLPVAPWDVPLHMVVTEQRIIERAA